MKFSLLKCSLMGLALVIIARPAAAALGQWQINTSGSGINFAIKNMGFPVKGKFKKVTGNVAYNDHDINSSAVQASVDIASIDTGIGLRDHHLKGKDFFNVKDFPDAEFRSTKIVSQPSGAFKVSGILLMHGVSKEVTLDAKPMGNAKVGQDGRSHLVAFATTILHRKDFGVDNFMAATVGNDVNVQLQVDLINKTD